MEPVKCKQCGVVVKHIKRHLAKHRKSKPSTSTRKAGRGRKAASNNMLAPVNTTGGVSRPRSTGILNKHTSVLNALSEAGRKFALRALHPNDETTGGGVMIPDAVNADRCVQELRAYLTLAAPPDAISAGTNWDCQLLALPLIDLPVIYRTRPSGQTWSSWKQLIVPKFNTGLVYLPEGNTPTSGDPKYATLVSETPQVLNEYTEFRQAFRGLTIIQDASAIANQGYVTSGQWGNKPVITLMKGQRSAPEITWPEDETGTQLESLVFYGVPEEVEDIIRACPEAGQWEARKGVYLPMRFDDPTHIMNPGAGQQLPVTDLESEQNVTKKAGLPVRLIPTGVTEETGLVPRQFLDDGIFTDAQGSRYARVRSTAGQINQAFGCVIFTGLDKTCNLVIRARSGLEAVPLPGTTSAGFTQKAPTQDNSAIAAVTNVSSQLPVAYEHKYNSLGLLLPVIGKALAAIAPTVLPWLYNKFVGNSAVPNV